MKLLETLQQSLTSVPAYVAENGNLNKWKVINDAQNYDATLLAHLLKNKQLKTGFFVEVGEALVFKLTDFVQFLEQKNFLKDSFTAYKNKIGLFNDGKYVKQRNDIVLAWPYKDCVLEGGQSREEDSRQEVFYNELLAQEDITQLLEPKLLTNARRIDVGGEHPLNKFNRNPAGLITDNLIVKGNNLLSLHSLRAQFAGSVKLIYIDPPYNTGNDGFRYNDSFNRSTWLTFMKNRFDIAKQLLRTDGAIFVQCDDNEQARLKVLMDEVFGEENYRETIVVKSSTPSGVNAVNVRRGERLFKVKEYLLFYSRDPAFRFNPLYVKSSFNSSYRYEVTKQKNGYQVSDLKKQFDDETKLERYALDNAANIFSLEKNNKKAGEKIKKVIALSAASDQVIEYINSHGQLVLVYKGGVFIPLKDRVVADGKNNYFGTLISDLWDDEIFQTNQSEGGVSLPGGKKPEKLLERILQLATKENDLVLDYHLGSGTTAAVAHKMNRQYIGLEQLDYGENDSVQRLKNVIAGDATGISKKTGWAGGGEFVYLELKKWNEAFIEKITAAKSTSSLIKFWGKMKIHSSLHYSADAKKFQENLDAFKQLTVAEQKRVLVDLLDKNQLYVNMSSMNDADYKCTATEKQISNLFYNK